MSNEKLMSVNEIWKLYREEVIPKDASEAQLRETKRAFFAGMQGMFELMLGPIAELSEEEGMQAMVSINRQFIGFVEAIQMGMS